MDLARRVEFLLEQGARTDSRIQQVATAVGELAQGQFRLIGHVEELQQSVLSVTAIARALAENQAHVQNEMQRLAEAQRHTDERLNTLIDIVDGHLRDHRRPVS